MKVTLTVRNKYDCKRESSRGFRATGVTTAAFEVADAGVRSSVFFFFFFFLSIRRIDERSKDWGRFAGRFAVGQNIARTWTTRPPGPYDGEPNWRRQISGWFNEVQYYHTGYSKATGHYTQVRNTERNPARKIAERSKRRL